MEPSLRESSYNFGFYVAAEIKSALRAQDKAEWNRNDSQCQNRRWYFTRTTENANMVIFYLYFRLVKSYFNIIISLELFVLNSCIFFNILYI